MKKVRHQLNYQQALIKSRSWQEIIEFYDYLKIEPMLDLVKYISENYSFGIYATTCMHTLCLAQTSGFDLNKNVLRVSFYENFFEFIYIDSAKTEHTGWKKVCPVDETISTFEHILKRLKWIIQ